MKIAELTQIKRELFGLDEVARTVGITRASAKVFLSRYTRKGIIIRIKRGVYMLRSTWERLDLAGQCKVANRVQVPSYVSFMTALGYWGISTQLQRAFIESAATKRTYVKNVGGTVFNYMKLDRRLYCGFKKERGIFIAVPEKAFLDAIYLGSCRKYSFDIASINKDAFDKKVLKKMLQLFPVRAKEYARSHGYITTA